MSVPTNLPPAGPVNEAQTLRLGMAAAARCRRRVHLDHDPGMDRSRQQAPDAGLQLRLDTLLAHKRAVHDRLSVGSPVGSPVGPLSMTLFEGWRPTDASRPAVAWSVRLADDNRFATVDLLLAMPDGGYAPVLIRGHRTTDPGHGARLTDLDDVVAWAAPSGDGDARFVPSRVDPHKKLRSHHRDALALAHVFRLLQKLGLASGQAWGGIIGFGGSSADATWDDGAVIAWHRLDAVSGRSTGSGNANGNVSVLTDYDERFADRLTVAQAAANRRPALAQPSRISECRRCPWWVVCRPELEAAHDVSLLVAGRDVDILRTAGAITYDDVAEMDSAVLTALPLTGIPAVEARVRARAMIAGVPMVRRTDVVDVVRADVEFDIDMESYLDDGAYLWGTYLTGLSVPGFERGYRPFVTWQPLDSADAAINFVEFWRYLSELRRTCTALGYTFAAYCYSHKAEERWLYGTPARFPDTPGIPTHDEVAEFCGSDQWVDLYREMKRLFVVPGSLRLKVVAPVSGFTWRDPEPGGENSMAWYQIATSSSATAEALGLVPAVGVESDNAVINNRQRILRYNEDDVRATLSLRQWMSDQSTAMPTAADLERSR